MTSRKSLYSLIYRLRSQGYRIDTRRRTVFVAADADGCVPAAGSRPLSRLCSEFNFRVQTALQEDSSRARVYISGPIAHYDLDERRRVFAHAKRMLRREGYLPVNPMDNGLPQPGDWRMHMRADIRNLLRCQFIYFLPDWQLSKGCRLELDVAASCGIKVLHF